MTKREGTSFDYLPAKSTKSPPPPPRTPRHPRDHRAHERHPQRAPEPEHHHLTHREPDRRPPLRVEGSRERVTPARLRQTKRLRLGIAQRGGLPRGLVPPVRPPGARIHHLRPRRAARRLQGPGISGRRRRRGAPAARTTHPSSRSPRRLREPPTTDLAGHSCRRRFARGSHELVEDGARMGRLARRGDGMGATRVRRERGRRVPRDASQHPRNRNPKIEKPEALPRVASRPPRLDSIAGAAAFTWARPVRPR